MEIKNPTLFWMIIIVGAVFLLGFGFTAGAQGWHKPSKPTTKPKGDGNGNWGEVALDQWGFPMNPGYGDIYWKDENGDGHNETKYIYTEEAEDWVKA